MAVPAPTTPEQACQYLLNCAASIMEYGRVETGTVASAELLAAYKFFAQLHQVPKQFGSASGPDAT